MYILSLLCRTLQVPFLSTWFSGPSLDNKVHIFLTGATGYVGGQALHAIASSTPSSHVSITCLVRGAEKGKIVQDAYPDHVVEVVIGDLDDVETIEEECRKSDLVLPDTKHMGAAHAIVKGLTWRSRTTGSKPTYIQMSGASLFVKSEVDSDRYGESPTTIWGDLGRGQRDIIEVIHANPSREMDNYIISQSVSTNVRTALVVGPLIYGTGSGPGNKRSIQAPEIARKTILDGGGFKLRRGLNVWSNIHIKDLGELFATLARTTMHGDRTSDTELDVWGENGVHLPSNGDMAFGDLCESIATEAHSQGFITSPTINSTIDVDEADAAMPGGAIFWGTNAVYKSEKAKVLLGWKPSAPSLQDTVAEMVRIEAERLKS